MHISTL